MCTVKRKRATLASDLPRNSGVQELGKSPQTLKREAPSIGGFPDFFLTLS